MKKQRKPRVIWLQNPADYFYLRQDTIVTSRATGWSKNQFSDRIVVGYEESAERRVWPGKFERRVWSLAKHDSGVSSDSPYNDGGMPQEAIEVQELAKQLHSEGIDQYAKGLLVALAMV